MTRRILRSIALIALLAVLPFGGNQRLAGQTSAPRFILCAPAAAVAGVAQRHGLTVVRPLDQHAHDIFLVTGPAGVATADLLASVRADSTVTNFEPDTTRSLTETGFGLNQSTVAILDQSTVAILDALTDRSLVPFGDLDVWKAYIDQPAASILRLPEAHAQYGLGSGVIALIDEGVDPNHGLLLPVLLPGYDFTRNLAGVASEWIDLDQKLIANLTQSTVAILDQSTVAILDGSTPAVLNQSTVAILDQSTVAILDTTQVPTGFGHGTMMAGAIRRAAPNASIMPLKAFNASGTAYLFDVVRAIYYAAENGANIIVMGFSTPEASLELAHAINFATSKGVIVVAAAGNDGRETLVYPAALRSVVGVGSTTPTDQRSAFSNFGDVLAKVGAPGEAIITAYPGGRYAAVAGTSFSAALVGGAMALIRQVDPAIGPAAATEAIGKGAANAATLKLGAGRANVFEAVKSRAPVQSVPPPPPPANVPPVAVNDMVSVAEDSSIVIDVRVNDSDADGNALVVSAVTPPSHGTAVVGSTEAGANKVTYSPAANFTGIDSFTYTISDGQATATAAVTVTVTGDNEVPVATADSVTTQEDTAVVVDVLSNDTDGDGEPLTLLSASGATRGTVSVETAGADAGRVRYVPTANAVGSDTFSYSVGDTRNGTASGTVTVTITAVNDAPVTANDSATGTEDAPIVVNVIANDTDSDGDSLSVTSVTQATKGSVTVVAEGASAGSLTYSPQANFFGSDSFAYTVEDGHGGTATGIVTVTVSAVNDSPAASADAASGQEDASIVIDVTANDSDVDGDRLRVTAVTQPSHGTATVVAEGADAGKIAYSPSANFSGADSFSYTVADGNGGTASATVSVSVASVNDVPVATDDTATLAEDGSIVVAVTANDSDADNDPVSVASLTQPANGTAAVVLEGADAGSITYRPAANFAGTDSFTYTIADAKGASATAAVVVTVTSVNDAPLAADDAATGPEDAVLVIDVIANDTDADRERVTVVSVTQPAHGSVTVLADGANAGAVSYTPAANFSGSDQFGYTVADGSGEQSTATVAVTVSPLNDQPIAAEDSGTVAEDASVAIQPLANDTDADGDTLTISAVSTPAHGTAVVEAGQVTYTPAANFAGADSFTYTIADGNGGSATATIGITVTPVDDAPVATDDAASGSEDAALVIDVVANDSDADGGRVTVANVTQPAHGTVTAAAGAGSVSYSPEANFAGTDRFTYTVTDGTGESAPATVTLTITPLNDQPAAADDSATTAEDTALSIAVTANDADPDGDALAVVSVTSPSNGTATVNAGQVTYTPAANFAGIDSFTYAIADGNGGSATASITVTVTAVDDAPVAADDVASGPEDAALVIDVVANDSDADGVRVTVANVTQPAHGTVSIAAGTATISYSPEANFSGTDRFTYTVTDGTGESAPATVTLTITPLNDQPAAADDSATTSEDTPLSIAVTANDADHDGDTLAVVSVAAPANGAATANAGQVTYTPAANFAGTDSFTYTISDGNGGSATASITVTVTAVDDAPSAADDAASGSEDAALVIDVVANDSDVDGRPVTVASVTQPAHGTVSIAAGNGSITYTPEANFAGTDRFTYTVTDGTGESAPATVTLTIAGLNDQPAAADDSATTLEDTALSIAVTANDADHDGDALAVVSVSAPMNGTATANAGQVTYTPAANYSGIDTFTYTIADGNGGSATANITVTVSAVDDAPVATDDAASGPEDAALVLDVVANDNDGDGGRVSVATLTQPAHGTVSIAAGTGSISYSPEANFSGTDRFTYTVTDGTGESAPATVTLTITPLNDQPTATDDSATGSEDTPLVVQAIANDSDPDGDAVTVVSVSAPARGMAAVSGGQITYTPAADFAGSDSFTYTIDDGNGASATATVRVTVTAVDDAPVAADDEDTTTEDTSVIVQPTANDVDPEGDVLTITSVSTPAHGTAVVEAGHVAYTPAANFVGVDSFTYTVATSTGGAATATITITVEAVDDAPVAVNDAVTGPEDAVVVVDVAANDTDADGDALRVTAVSPPAHGTVSMLQGADAGKLSYTPAPDFSGTDTFKYTVTDGTTTATGVVSIVVTALNDAPAAVADNVTTAEDAAVTIQPLANDSDPDGDTLSVAEVGAPGFGTAIVGASGEVVYTPTANFSGTDRFSYAVSDGNGGVSTGTIDVTVAAANDAPSAGDDAVLLAVDATSLNINVLENDSTSPDTGESLAILAVSTAAGGLVAIEGSSILYTPTVGFTGTDTFTYTIGDGHGGTDTATVIVTVVVP